MAVTEIDPTIEHADLGALHASVEQLLAFRSPRTTDRGRDGVVLAARYEA